MIGFIGLGWTGEGMCQCVIRAGYEVGVFARKPHVAQGMMDFGAKYNAPTKKDLAEHCEIIHIVVIDDKQVREVCEGEEGLIANMKPGSVIIIHSTVSRKTVFAMAELGAPRGVEVIDAPFSGPRPSEKKEITIMVGCTDETWERIYPILSSMGNALHIGPVGSGLTAKIVNNTILSTILYGTTEALIMAEKAGANIDKVVEVLRMPNTTSNSWVIDNYDVLCDYKRMWRNEKTGPLKTMPKDLSLGLELAKEVGVEMPVNSAGYGIDYGIAPERFQ